MSALGQKQTWRSASATSALLPKADIAGRQLDVRFVPKADVSQCKSLSFLDLVALAFAAIRRASSHEQLGRQARQT